MRAALLPHRRLGGRAGEADPTEGEGFGPWEPPFSIIVGTAARHRPTSNTNRAALLWQAPTQLNRPVVRVLADGAYLSVVIDPTIRATRRDTGVAPPGPDKTSPHSTPRSTRTANPGRLVRVVDYGIADRAGIATGELTVLLTTVTDPADASADELPGGRPFDLAVSPEPLRRWAARGCRSRSPRRRPSWDSVAGWLRSDPPAIP